MKKETGVSPWLTAAWATFSGDGLLPVFQKEIAGFGFDAYNTGDAFWVVISWPNACRVAIRTAFVPGGVLQLEKTEEGDNEVAFSFSSIIGSFNVKLRFPTADKPLLRCTTSLRPAEALSIPFWPRDLLMLGKEQDFTLPEGEVHLQQQGPRSGLLYASIKKPRTGAFLYMQNLTAISDYCDQTNTTVAGSVGGSWPELGFALPPTKEKPLEAGREYIISDAFLLCDKTVPADELRMARQFLDLLAGIYVHFPQPATTYQPWLEIVEKTLNDLQYSPGCWTQVQGKPYLNAYVCDYTAPPEIMVQLAVLVPIMEYASWSRSNIPMISYMNQGLPAFYDERISCIARWLPAAEDKLDGKEEQKKPRVMDAWYLHHPMLNLSRMALAGDEMAKKLFLDSLEYVISVARHFKYQWPVFYNLDTLEVIKAETKPGKGGEKDVPGLYAHVMLQAWEITGEKRYLEEAKKAAKALQGTGFSMFYQANNTAFSAGAMLRLWKATKNKLYLDLSYLCLANVFKNVWLWDCNYGYAKHYPTFFALFPLDDAPYTAVYEEQEGFAAFHDFLHHAEGVDILPSVNLLIPEFIKHLVNKAAFYYPPKLPKEILAEKPKTGEIDPKLWIPLEDMYDGWTKPGEVGQEVYGAGLAFGIVPRHYHAVPGHFMMFIDYPVIDFSIKKDNAVHFTVMGNEQGRCRLLLLPSGDKSLPVFTVSNQEGEINGKQNKDGFMEYDVRGGQQLSIHWKETPGRSRKQLNKTQTRTKQSAINTLK